MKKTIFVCLAAFVLAALVPQAEASGAGIKAGFSVARIRETAATLPFEWQDLRFVTGGVSFGGGYGLLSIESEFLYVQQGGTFAIDAANGFKDRYHYIQVPVQLRINLVPAGMVRPFVAGGAYGAYLIKAEADDLVDGVRVKTNITSDFKRYDWGVLGSAGVAFKLPALVLSLEARYNHGLLNVLRNPAAGSSVKNRCWMVLVGLSY